MLILLEHELSWYAFNFLSPYSAIILFLTYSRAWLSPKPILYPSTTQNIARRIHVPQMLHFSEGLQLFQTLTWGKNVCKISLNSYVFGWINFFADMDIYWMLLQSCKPDNVPWNTSTVGNKTAVKPQSLKSLYLLFLLEWFWKIDFCFGANLSIYSK